MISTRVRRCALVMVAVLVAGVSLTTAPVVAKKKSNPSNYPDLSKAPKPKISGAEIVEGLEEFVGQFPLRQTQTPHNILAADFLAAEAEKYGFDAEIRQVGAPGAPGPFRVVEAIKKGTTKPKEWIAFVAHYDIVPQTIEGAYDDGSGTNMLRYFAKVFEKIDTKRSIALLWFDAEEAGLLASEAYAADLEAKGQKLAAVLGFDMVGIGHPAPYCICIYHGREDAEKAVPIARYVNFDFLGFPEGNGMVPKGHVCVCGQNIRNSDESNFAQRGYFTMRWAGMRAASDYPAYHRPQDTVATMEDVAGGRKNLEAGTLNTFLSAYYTTWLLDRM